jgi:uncharacterized protein YndB with AHSA1/START domain
MTDAVSESNVVLRMERTFDAPRERVFDAWTNPEVLRRWWAADPEWDTPLAEVDLREGGRLRLSMHDPSSGAVHSGGGVYTEIRPPERLAYTWAWEDESNAGPGSQETLVTVDFDEDGGRTTVTLTHSGLPSEESRDNHEHGWGACFDNLERRALAA